MSGGGLAVLGAGLRAEGLSEGRSEGRLLPAASRRRASELTRAIADALETAAAEAGRDPATLPLVVASATGEMETTVALFEQLGLPGEPLSPMRFSASVHNTAAGMLSIGLGQTGFTSSVAAGRETVAAGLLEAEVFVLAEGAEIAVVFADGDFGGDLVPPESRFGTLAVAFVLGPGSRTSGAGAVRLGPVERAARAGTHALEVPPRLRRNPCAPALDLLDLVRSRRRGRVALEPSPDLPWTVRVEEAGR